MAVQTQIQARRGTAATWTSTNPTLAAGETGYETDTGKFKIGTGSTAWASLGYFNQDPVTTKGDLFTFSTTDARLAVGNNGESLVADSAATTGLRYSATPSASNPVLNSAMQNWQRGTTFATTAATYTADRWYAGLASAGTVTRQTTSDTTNLPFIQYCARFARTAASASTTALELSQSFESVNSIPFAGKTVTYSFYARAGANYSPTSGNLQVILKTGTGTDQNTSAGYTGSTLANNSNVVLTTTWQRFSVSAALASTITEIGLMLIANVTGTAGAADYFEVTGVQLDIGSVALPFRTYAATIQGELAACQRYYYRAVSGAAYGQFGGNPAYTTGTVSPAIAFPVVMRTVPTAVDTTGVGGFILENNSSVSASAFTSIAINTSVTTSQLGVIDIVKSLGFTTGIFYKLIANNSSSAFIGFSAEL